MSTRRKLAWLGVVVLVATLAPVAYAMYDRWDRRRLLVGAAPSVPVLEDYRAVQGPRIVFRSTAEGSGYGRVAVVSLAEPGGPRALTPATCDRVHAVPTQVVCLSAKPGWTTVYSAQMLASDWSSTRDLPLAGVPSRTRISRDGMLVATTTFVSGHDYASPGQFSTQTLVTDLVAGGSTDIETFELVVNSQLVANRDRNMWGVTFVDDDTFYAAAASGNKTWLVQGSLATRRLVALREDAECPSLSPDGTRIAFKTRAGLPPGQWRIAVYTIASGQAITLAEQHSVDDQIEWLDDTHVLYGLQRSGEGRSTTDVWVLPADGSGTPQLLIPDAWSPAVLR